MRTAVAVVALLGLLGPGNESINFDAVKPGVAPPNWTFVSAIGAPRARWEVRYDPSAPSRDNVLKPMNGSSRESESPVAIFDKVICRDGDLTVKFRIEGHGRGRSAGIVWRYQDPANYYLLHFSADEKNIALFKVKDGHSAPVPVTVEGAAVPEGTGHSGVYHDLHLGQWYIAKVTFRGPKIRVLFGNRKLFDAEDSTFSGAGKTGVWTHGKTTAAFDDFRIEKKS
ncbi:MAG: hypothetical protein QOJ99_2743 [Bryobacterales bacterium]|jgi:hypothetical protein|nr:hypothetical protein [Bryobacterales bacterium]